MPSSVVLILIVILIYLITRLFKTKNRDKIFLAVSFLFLFILSASREFTVGNDMESYLRLFRDSGELGIEKLALNEYYEQGFVLFNIVLSAINPNPRFFLIVTSFIICFSIFNFIRKESKNYLLSVCIFIGSLLFFSSMNLIRQFLALSILLFSIDFAKRRRPFLFLIIVLFASLIHTSAILGLLFYVIYNVKITKKRIWGLLISSGLLTIMAPSILSLVISFVGRNNYYIKYFDVVHLANVCLAIINILIFLCCYFIVRRKQDFSTIDRDASANLFVLLFIAIFSIISMRISVVDRTIAYFQVLMLAALPNLISQYIQIQRQRIIVEIIVIVALFTYSSVIIINRPNWNSAFNYRSCIIPEENYICE